MTTTNNNADADEFCDKTRNWWAETARMIDAGYARFLRSRGLPDYNTWALMRAPHDKKQPRIYTRKESDKPVALKRGENGTRYAAAASAGLCSKCCKAPRETGKCMCGVCAALVADRARELYHARKLSSPSPAPPRHDRAGAEPAVNSSGGSCDESGPHNGAACMPRLLSRNKK